MLGISNARHVKGLIGTAVLGLALLGGPMSKSASAHSGGPLAARAAGACTLFSNPDVYAENPRLEWPNVWMTGGIDWGGLPYCFPDLSGVYAQTKACGVFGCNWQTRASVEYTPWHGMRETPGMACRKGTNRYRTHTVLGYRVPGETGLEPGLPYPQDSDASPEFSCK